MDIKELLFSLSNCDSIGSLNTASDLAFDILSKYAETKMQNKNNIIGFLKGKSDYTVMLDAHIDQVGFVVTNVAGNGFLTVKNVGGIDLRALPSSTVTVHGKKDITAVFCSIPPHLSHGEFEYNDIQKLKVDTALGAKAAEIVSVGDYVTFSGDAVTLSDNMLSGRSFDDRAGVACLLETASRLYKKELPVNVVFSLSSCEEVGMRGICTAAYDVCPDEAIAVDVTFGIDRTVSADEGCLLGGGGMIGVSPTLCKSVSDKLTEIAKENSIPYGLEVMGGKTGTNADMIAISRGGVKTATLSIPIRNMHLPCEVVNICDLNAVCDLLEKYILSGGALNA